MTSNDAQFNYPLKATDADVPNDAQDVGERGARFEWDEEQGFFCDRGIELTTTDVLRTLNAEARITELEGERDDAINRANGWDATLEKAVLSWKQRAEQAEAQVEELTHDLNEHKTRADVNHEEAAAYRTAYRAASDTGGNEYRYSLNTWVTNKKAQVKGLRAALHAEHNGIRWETNQPPITWEECEDCAAALTTEKDLRGEPDDELCARCGKEPRWTDHGGSRFCATCINAIAGGEPEVQDGKS